MSKSTTKTSHAAAEAPAAVPRSATTALKSVPSAMKAAPSRIEPPTMTPKARQASASPPSPRPVISAATPKPITVAMARMATWPANLPSTIRQRVTGYVIRSGIVPRSISPTSAS